MIGNYLHLSDADFIDELYREWQEDPDSVDEHWRGYFQRLHNGQLDAALEGEGFPDTRENHSSGPVAGAGEPAILSPENPDTGARGLTSSGVKTPLPLSRNSQAYKQSRVNAMIWAYRDIGYLYAELNPLKGYITPDLWYMMFSIEGTYETLTLEEFGLSEEDLDTPFLTGRFMPEESLPLREIVERLRRTYCGTVGSEILHIQNKAVRNWLLKRLEGEKARSPWGNREKMQFQQDLIKAEEFERFIHSNFIGQKRFSLEGGEVLIPALHYLFDHMLDYGVEETVLGMAHRGRLNVFVNAMGKPAKDIFARFVDNYVPHTYGGSGDVKYHLGFSADYRREDREECLHIGLVANPSHLEAVNPVVEGKTRGVQRRRKDRHRKKVIPVLIHGDSAFSGQGVVSETLNLSQLKGYKTGGTIHIIVNNQIGFTTASRDSRSTFFATDIARSISIPVFHANSDDPEGVVWAMDLALKFRQKFGQDVIVDIICYRRLGHNEADEPSFSHPKMYNQIKSHKTGRELYADTLDDQGVWKLADQKEYAGQYVGELKQHLEEARDGFEPRMDDAYQGAVWKDFRRTYSHAPVPTGVERKVLDKIAETLVTLPENFHVHPKLQRFTKGRRKQYFEDDNIDWAFAESLAFGSLLLEDHSIRLSGEDCRRGTFSQRHAVWWDVESSEPKSYVPLRFMEDNQGWFSVYDSPLSEFAVLGFDYGYSLAMPNDLILWEGQFGDFVNGAQVIIDQFIAAAETKWFRSSGLVMLLPHGYEGQGPEHSSAFYERFLSLCSDQNMQVVNATTPAQYFHVLRRQMKQDYRKPLIIMSPKSLLRSKDCASTIEELENGHFQTVMDDDVDKQNVRKVILCSGKVFYDLAAEREKRNGAETAIIRLEQPYPFPAERLSEVISSYSKAERFLWVQEETENRGAWQFVHYRQDRFMPGNSRLEYVGRKASPSPATGSHKQHVQELADIMEAAFS